MYKKYYNKRKGDEDDVSRIISGILGLILMYLVFIYFVNKKQFWQDMNSYIFPIIGLIILVAGGYLFYLYKTKKKKENHFKIVLQQIKENNFEVNIKNFIDRFGKEGKVKPWSYRDYKFDWKRLEDFRENVIQNKIDVYKENYGELLLVLKYYIDAKEKDYLNQGIETKVSHDISELSKNGDDFENLIVRLYNAMGYSSKRIGGHGDQGGDVIARKNGENLLIQAKCYTGSVGNKAVQEAVAARQYYGCTKAAVITTFFFTPEAISLAKSNFIELIDGNLLKHKLLEYLNEKWQ